MEKFYSQLNVVLERIAAVIFRYRISYFVFDEIQFGYFLLIFFVFLSFIICSILLFLSQKFALQVSDSSKLLSYECGFNPFNQARVIFDVQYYVLGILFILFDVEVFFILTWCLVLLHLVFYSFFIMLVFILFLMLGFIYEWRLGLLEWV